MAVWRSIVLAGYIVQIVKKMVKLPLQINMLGGHEVGMRITTFWDILGVTARQHCWGEIHHVAIG